MTWTFWGKKRNSKPNETQQSQLGYERGDEGKRKVKQKRRLAKRGSAGVFKNRE